MTQTENDARNQALRDALEVLDRAVRYTHEEATRKFIAEASRLLRLTLAMQEPASEPAKGACPVCGCEEVDHRDLWTCRCPASEPAPTMCKACNGTGLGVNQAHRCPSCHGSGAASEPAPASAPSCCGAWKALEEIADLGSDGTHSGDRHARCRKIAWEALAARAQPCRCGELREENEKLRQQIDKMEAGAHHMLERMVDACQCETPAIKCDNTGCRCIRCGKLERAPQLRAATAPRSGEG